MVRADARPLVKEMFRLAEDGSRHGPGKRQDLHNRLLADHVGMVLGGKMGENRNIPKSTTVEGKRGLKDYLLMKRARLLKASGCLGFLGKSFDPNSSEYDHPKTFVRQTSVLFRFHDAKREACAAAKRERRLSGRPA